MTIDPFSYDLPRHLIAERPVSPPDAARLLLVDRQNHAIADAVFSDLPSLVSRSDLFVLNNTRVVPARLVGKFEEDSREVELLLLQEVELGTWRCIGKPMRRLSSGATMVFGSDHPEQVFGTVVSEPQNGEVLVTFRTEDSDISSALKHVGSMPIPPYIRQGRGDDQDRIDYQTCFGVIDGSVAAPTASLHFTPELIEELSSKAAGICHITLHVGSGSFRQIGKGGGNAEYCEFPHGSWEQIVQHKRKGGRIVAVGTTVVRAIESRAHGIVGDTGETELLITPQHDFRVVDDLITNFHQPGTTHLLLVEALIGRDLLARAYSHALSSAYRFLSYGDGMLIRGASYDA